MQEKVMRHGLTRAAATAAVLLLAGCGSSPAAPTSATPAPPTFTVVDTVAGQAIPNYTVQSNGSHMVFTALGYVTRHADPRQQMIDLFPEAGFDLTFYRQLARNEYEGTRGSLRVLREAPAFYLQTLHLTDLQAAALEATTRAVVPMWTGGRFTVTAWETGREPRPLRAGWIIIDIAQTDPTGWCGRAPVGAAQGHIELTLGVPGCTRPIVHVLAHELGHALGFSHVADATSLMSPVRPVASDGLPTAKERHHAALAYARQPGNQDVDVDPLAPSRGTALVVVD